MSDAWERAVQEELPRLAGLLHTSDIEEIEIADSERSIRVRRFSKPHATSDGAPGTAGASAAAPVGPAVARAEAVGVFYRSREGEAMPVAEAGTEVSEGDVLGFVDVLGVMHDVVAPAHGRLLRFLTNEGDPVGYGQGIAEIVPGRSESS